jgi:hypothetical protein
MSRYERQWVEAEALQDGDTFELPGKPETVCRANYVNLVEQDEWQYKVIGYDIIEGPLHFPVIHLPPGFRVILLLPTTTYVQMSGKDWVDSLTEQHGVKK